MSDEIKEVKEETCKCFCKSEGVKKVAIVALGTFIGVYAALSLFAATHKPPIRPNHHMHRPPIEQRSDIERGPRGDFHKIKFEKRAFKGDASVRAEANGPKD